MTKDAETAATLIALERAALDRWGKGEPSGYLEISAPDVTYFDPFLERRLDGLQALSAYYETLRGKVRIDRWQLLDPEVQVCGDVAVLSFRLVSQAGTATMRWNCTEVFRRGPAGWRLIHTHWAVTQSLA